jgi:hypothetical protein
MAVSGKINVVMTTHNVMALFQSSVGHLGIQSNSPKSSTGTTLI